jgi:predicted aldo/keto reductase-like oxidoreductase
MLMGTIDFQHTVLGRTGMQAHRLGISATYRPGAATLHNAFDAGVNLVFAFGVDSQMTRFVRTLSPSRREKLILVTGAYNLVLGYQNLEKTLHARLRQFGTDVIDVFLFLGVMKEKEFPERAREELQMLKETGKVRYVGMSCHDRHFAGRMAATGSLDVLMIRYNAAHPGAEREIFPFLQPHDPGVLGYTATRWSYLLRRPRGWPRDAPVPTAGDCYRFVLSQPAVHVCLTAPRSGRELAENLSAIQKGPLSEEEQAFMRSFGEAVHQRHGWFMESRSRTDRV